MVVAVATWPPPAGWEWAIFFPLTRCLAVIPGAVFREARLEAGNPAAGFPAEAGDCPAEAEDCPEAVVATFPEGAAEDRQEAAVARPFGHLDPSHLSSQSHRSLRPVNPSQAPCRLARYRWWLPSHRRC